MNIDMSKYRFYTSKNKVYAVSTYACRPVKGVAKCDPDDEFSIEYGKELAVARCNEKIAEKRVKRAKRKFKEAHDDYVSAKRFYDDMTKYLDDSLVAHADAKKYVEDVLAKLD